MRESWERGRAERELREGPKRGTKERALREREFKRELKGVGGRKFGRELKGEGATSTLLSSYILCPPKGEAAIRLL